MTDGVYVNTYNFNPIFNKINTNKIPLFKDAKKYETDKAIFHTNNAAPIKKETLEQIKNLKGPAFLNTKKLVSILLKDRGLEPNFITARNKTFRFIINNFFGKQDNKLAEFHLASGELHITKGLTVYMNNAQYAALIAHEIDHLINAAKLCKAIGVNEYQKLFNHAEDVKKINKDFWIKASNAVDIEGFNPKPFQESIAKGYLKGFGDAAALMYEYQYLTNPLEESAYNVQYYIEDELKTKPGLINNRDFAELVEDIIVAVNNAEEKNPKISGYVNALVDLLYLDALSSIHEPLLELSNKIEECAETGEPVFEYEKQYKKEIIKARNKMSPLTFSNILNGQKCHEARIVFLTRIRELLDELPLEKYLKIAMQRRLTKLKNINAKNLTESRRIALENEMRQVEENLEKLTET